MVAAASIFESRRLLVRAPNWLGDVVMSLPALSAIRRAAPRSHVTLAVPGHTTDLLARAEGVDAVVAVGRDVRSLPSSARTFGALGFDAAVLLPNSLLSALEVWLARVPRRAGYARDGRSPLLTRAVPLDARRRALHQSERYLELVRELGAPYELDRTRPARLVVPAAAREQVSSVLAAERKRPGAPMVVLAPCATGPGREWPPERFARLAGLLWEGGAEVVLTASAAEREKCAAVAEIARRDGSEVIDVAGRNTVAQMAALFEVADGFVGNNSGPMHLAGAMGLPAVGVFVNTEPALTGPLGPCTATVGGPGASPTSEEVAARLGELVRRGSSRPHPR